MVKLYRSPQLKRKVRVRSKLSSVASRPRLTVHRSNKHIYAQVIDEVSGKTIVSSSDTVLKSAQKATKTNLAELVGADIATKAKKAKVSKVYFDRGHYKFHGRVKALAQAARANGLEF